MDCKTGILMLPPQPGSESGTTNIVLDTVAFPGVSAPVADTTGKVLLSGTDPLEVLDVWTLGNIYVQGNSSANTQGVPAYTAGTHVSPNRNKLLTNGDTGAWSSKWYHYQAKPQYQDIDITAFANAKDYGAKGQSWSSIKLSLTRFRLTF